MAVQPGPKGPVTPEKYPVPVGEKYLYYGEQPGYIYDPYSDSYKPDPKQATQYYEDQGLLEPEPKPPGLAEQLIPVAAVGGSLALAQSGGKAIADKIPGMFGSGAAKTQLPTVTGGANAATGTTASSLSSAGPAPVGSAALADGSAGTLLADGSVVGSGTVPESTGLFSSGSLGSIAQTAAPIAAIAYGLNAGKDFLSGDKLNWGQKAALALPTAGLSLFSDQLQSAFGIGQPSTKEVQQGNWGNLAGQVTADSPTAQYIANYQKEIENPSWKQNGTEPKKFEDMQGLDLTPGLAFFQTAGNEWLEGLSEQERINIAQGSKDKGFIESKKGDIVATNPDGILQLIEEEKAKRNQEQPKGMM